MKIIAVILVTLTLAACGAGPGFGCKVVTPTGYCSYKAP